VAFGVQFESSGVGTEVEPGGREGGRKGGGVSIEGGRGEVEEFES